jgi:hypothetical protein
MFIPAVGTRRQVAPLLEERGGPSVANAGSSQACSFFVWRALAMIN